ncbi:hydroxyacylglutathione hydrolase [Listeria grayi]|uniref:Metallo-beta-lactamase domain-containing protein n=1 Tax=Listeria grayi FSL F6-1183 TaxID=1265827 RepID=A0A829R893_LISGR|nr:MBL fold metallo-hydrolase [Listeria grayi]EUJ28937.1 hypothetical protein LMUR_04820 [Listeria grayi FSL F6-1183]VEI35675.1 hydroxyacylglutathione hydrolase [Listeria grayi]
MIVDRIVTGLIEENCYIIHQDKKALIVDPGAEAELIIAKIKELAVEPVAILLTHCHFDHIGALEEVRNTYEIPVYVSPLEQEWLANPEFNGSAAFSAYANHPVICEPAEYELEMKEYDIEGFRFRVVPTPGHSIGSVSYIFADFVISGDALFKGSVGRSDLYTGDHETLIAGIKKHLFTLPDAFKVYPGHRDSTTIGYEKETNPYFQANGN